MSIRSLADFNGSSWAGAVTGWHRTVTAQASRSRTTRRTKDEDFYLATSEDLEPATRGDFLMATDRTGVHARGARPALAVTGRRLDSRARPVFRIDGGLPP